MGARLRKNIVYLAVILLLLPTFCIPTYADENNKITSTLQLSEVEGEEIDVVISGNYMLIPVTESGKVLIYDLEGNLKKTLQSPTPDEEWGFGVSLVANDEVIVVGENRAKVDGLVFAGQVHVYDYEGNLLNTIKSPEPQVEMWFGSSLEFIGDMLAIGAPKVNIDDLINAGKIYFMDIEGELQASIRSPEPQSRALFGWRIESYGDIFVVCEEHAVVENIASAGKAHVFDIDGTHVASLHDPEPTITGAFGSYIALDEEIIVIGSDYAKVDGFKKAGKAHVFDVAGEYLFSVQSPEPSAKGFFGNAVALSSDFIIVGETGADGEYEDEGRVHVFDRKGNLVTSLYAPEPVEEGVFGYGVGVIDDEISVNEVETGKIYFFQVKYTTFEVNGLTVKPSSVKEGETLSISCDVANTGTSAGSHTVTLKIGDEIKEEKTLSLDAGSTETVTFEVTCESIGVFTVDVNGKTGSYEVTKAQTGIPGFPIMSILAAFAIYYLILEFGK